ncbi:succinate dehydrogenase [Candidatus Sumerlaeota bacterium]|nr:succinate dehydrogenase [Candidatus Sumerlaeota bacterium]
MTNTRYFYLRRLHSLLGVIPLGVFLLNHLLTNSTAIISAEFFEEKVKLIHLLGPFLPIVEAVLIFVPLSLHVALGIYIASQAKMNTSTIKYARNYAYSFQRITGWIAVVYISYHVIHLRFMHDMHQEPFSITLAKMFSEGLWGLPGVVWILLYFIGGLSVIFHFANGLCTFCMRWGITVGPKSQRSMAYVAGGLGVMLTLMLISSIVGFARVAPRMKSEPGLEQKLIQIHEPKEIG